ncbi:MAG: NgoFVII family restriction endonuclease [Acidimicrobiia bacterium]|nr:NgoFVII family restriction endonuclease [Acidimicrobiia bacterium]MYC57218.1 NgoFVII family restriction endonuclease [Acidimicrobiia bacterium]MYG93855.1 NgoFVII family restriction endonuclease [Acidimicrobiia bacterium]MYI29858.1 NgoFVII family restriction endonuclease [Acidimicrobiia bacterium]
MGFGFDTQVMKRIERFLVDYPIGHLHVVTGYTSMAGLAWLARKAAKRPVTVVIGDLRTGLDNFEARDAAEVVKFISRPDVRILNWYRTAKNQKGPAIAHSKMFAVEVPKGQPIAVLAGSANLTMTGLSANVETMVEAVQEDREAAFKQVLWLEKQGWDATDRIMKKARSKERETVGAGCLPALVSTPLAIVRFVAHGRFSVRRLR